jgi:uncharacterized protein (TIGR02145 family)
MAGAKLKETGTSHWNSTNIGSYNESGFTALPGGIRRSNNGQFEQIGGTGAWWSATYNSPFAIGRFIYSSGNDINSDSFIPLRSGLSVRCLKD